MKKYKIVCSDLDGTLLNDIPDVSPENLAAIEEMSKIGVAFVPSTGRCFSELPAAIKNNPFIRFYICSNGAVVLDRATDKQLLTCISREISNKILDILYCCQTHISMRQNCNCYVDAAYANEEAFEYYNVCQAHRVVVNDFAVLRKDFKEFCYEADNVEVISVFFRDDSELLACKQKIARLGGLRIVSVSECNLEIMNVQAGKGNALHAIADMLNADHADTIAVGDSENDCSMVEAAGLGLAVSNACDLLLQVADEKICSNNEHAIVYILKHYL